MTEDTFTSERRLWRLAWSKWRELGSSDIGGAIRTVVGIRIVFWVGAAASLLWTPLHQARAIPPFRAYGGASDLLFGTFAQWDSVWFIHIADHGYDSEQIAAFFPLYPLLVRELSHVVGSTLVAGVLLSLFAAAIAAAALQRLARAVLHERAVGDALLYVALYPFAYVFTALYSDGLFLALAALSLLAAQRRRGVLAGVFGALAVATRIMGLALIPALIVLLWPRRRDVRGISRVAPVLLLPASLGLYALYLRSRLDDPWAFIHAQSGPSWNRSLSAFGPIDGFLEAASSAAHGALELLRHLPASQGYPHGYPPQDQWASWNVLQFIVLLAAFWLTFVAWQRLGAAYGLYSVATLLIFLSEPAQFVPLVSVPRFLLGDFPLFFALADMTASRPVARQRLVIGMSAVAGVAAVAFAHKVWVA